MELKFERVCLPLLLLHVNRCGKGPGDWQRKVGTQGRAAGEDWQAGEGCRGGLAGEGERGASGASGGLPALQTEFLPLSVCPAAAAGMPGGPMSGRRILSAAGS
jgi:hypothetical protein